MGALFALAASLIILKCFGFKGAPIIAAIAFVTLSASALSGMPAFLSLFEQLRSFVADRYIDSAVRIVGVSYLCGISGDVCRELGEGGIAKSISVISKLEMIAIAAPFISEIFSELTDLIGAG